MSNEPANRRDTPGGGKEYLHPITGERFDSVTTPLEFWDKTRLLQWATGLSAEMAIDSVPMLLQASLNPDCGNTHNRCYQKHGRENRCERCPCGACSACWQRRIQWRHAAESSRRADEGTELHTAINHWVLTGGDRTTLRPEVAPYFQTFLQWVADYGLKPHDGLSPYGNSSWEQTEVTLINREHMYAGTSDAAVWIHESAGPAAGPFIQNLRKRGAIPNNIDHALVRIDYKSREKPNEALFNDMALQGEAYENCTHVMLPDGTEHPAPKTAVRCILQVRPDGYTFKVMKSGPRVFRVFLALLEAYRWARDEGGKAAFDQTLPWLNPQPFQPDPPGGVLAVPDTSNPHGVTPSLLESPPAPPKKATKRTSAAAKKSITTVEDPFAVVAASRSAPRGSVADARRGRSERYPAGQPNMQALDDEIPF